MPTPAFLPAIPPFPSPCCIHPISRTACPRRRPLHMCAATPASASPPLGDEDAIHDSWHIYSKPGNLCVICAGKGSTKCLFCYGEGEVRIGPEVGRDSVCCPHCEGTGTEPCIRCEGSGKRPDTRYDVETGKYVRNLTNLEVCNMKNEYADDELGKDTNLKDAVDSTEASSDADIRNDVDVSVDVVRL